VRREGATTARSVANIGAGAAMEIPEEDPGAEDLPVHRLTPCTSMEAFNKGVGRVGAEEDLDADGLGEGVASEDSYTGGELWATATTPEKDKVAEENCRQESEKMADIGSWAVMVVEVAEEYSHADNMRSLTSAEEASTGSEDLCEEEMGSWDGTIASGEDSCDADEESQYSTKVMDLAEEEPVETLRGFCSGRKPKLRLTTHSMWGEVIARE